MNTYEVILEWYKNDVLINTQNINYSSNSHKDCLESITTIAIKLLKQFDNECVINAYTNCQPEKKIYIGLQ